MVPVTGRRDLFVIEDVWDTLRASLIARSVFAVSGSASSVAFSLEVPGVCASWTSFVYFIGVFHFILQIFTALADEADANLWIRRNLSGSNLEEFAPWWCYFVFRWYTTASQTAVITSHAPSILSVLSSAISAITTGTLTSSAATSLWFIVLFAILDAVVDVLTFRSTRRTDQPEEKDEGAETIDETILNMNPPTPFGVIDVISSVRTTRNRTISIARLYNEETSLF